LDNYTKLANDNLKRLFDSMPSDLQERLPGDQDGERYTFTAFGKLCTLSPDGISLDRIAPPGCDRHSFVPVCPACVKGSAGS
jgi:hypothetical protein